MSPRLIDVAGALAPAQRRALPVRLAVAADVMASDTIEWPMVLPSGELGLRCVGHPVLVRLDRDLEVRVVSPSSDRVIAHGIVNSGSIYWIERGAELSDTAREIVEATVVHHVLRVLTHAGAHDWPTSRQRWELRS